MGAAHPRRARNPALTSEGRVAPLRSVVPDLTPSKRQESEVRNISTTLHHPKSKAKVKVKIKNAGGTRKPPRLAPTKRPGFQVPPAPLSCHPPEVKVKDHSQDQRKGGRVDAQPLKARVLT